MYTIQQIKEIVDKSGSHYFEKSTMRFFNQRLSSFHVLQSHSGRYFIACRSTWSGRLMGYSFAEFNPNNKENPLPYIWHPNFKNLSEVKNFIKDL